MASFGSRDICGVRNVGPCHRIVSCFSLNKCPLGHPRKYGTLPEDIKSVVVLLRVAFVSDRRGAAHVRNRIEIKMRCSQVFVKKKSCSMVARLLSLTVTALLCRNFSSVVPQGIFISNHKGPVRRQCTNCKSCLSSRNDWGRGDFY